MGKASRDKGNRTERAIVHLLQEKGIAGEKVSGMYKQGPDLSVPYWGRDLRGEVKCRADGFKAIYDWLVDRDVLFLKADHKEVLVVIRLKDVEAT